MAMHHFYGENLNRVVSVARSMEEIKDVLQTAMRAGWQKAQMEITILDIPAFLASIIDMEKQIEESRTKMSNDDIERLAKLVMRRIVEEAMAESVRAEGV